MQTNGGEKPGGAAADPVRATWNQMAVEELRSLQEPGEADLVAELVDTFHVDARPLCDRLEQAAARGDLAEVRQVAHRIKGSALNLGAERLAGAAGALEAAAVRGEANPALVASVVAEQARFFARAPAEAPATPPAAR